MHPLEQLGDGESAVLLTYHLYYVELWQWAALSQSELIATQKLPLRDAQHWSHPLLLGAGRGREGQGAGRCQVMV